MVESTEKLNTQCPQHLSNSGMGTKICNWLQYVIDYSKNTQITSDHQFAQKEHQNIHLLNGTNIVLEPVFTPRAAVDCLISWVRIQLLLDITPPRVSIKVGRLFQQFQEVCFHLQVHRTCSAYRQPFDFNWPEITPKSLNQHVTVHNNCTQINMHCNSNSIIKIHNYLTA